MWSGLSYLTSRYFTDTVYLYTFLTVMFKQFIVKGEKKVRLGSIMIRSHRPANFYIIHLFIYFWKSVRQNSPYHIYIDQIKG